MHPEALALRGQYPSGAQLLAIYNPDVTCRVLAIRDRRRIYFGQVPTLNVVSEAYGRNEAVAWVEIQLESLSEYAGAREKLTPAVLHELASIVVAKYWYLRLSEFMLFVAEFKAGTFGRFYGTVDPMVIGDALRRFDRQRQEDMDRIVREDRQRAREAEEATSSSKACSYTEWQGRKAALGRVLTALMASRVF